MKGNYKITIVDLDLNKVLLDTEVDELDLSMNRPLEPEYGTTPETWARPTGFKQTGPTVWSIEGKKSP